MHLIVIRIITRYGVTNLLDLVVRLAQFPLHVHNYPYLKKINLSWKCLGNRKTYRIISPII